MSDTRMKDRLAPLNNGEKHQKKRLDNKTNERILWRQDLKKVYFAAKTGLKGNFEETEAQDDKQTNGSICLKLKRWKSKKDKEKT